MRRGYKNWCPLKNIIVVDGGSTDKTVEIAKSKNVLVVPQRGRDKADAIKMGLEYVKIYRCDGR
ncbi:MAG: glycosyltransferase [Ignisphaera sp.]